jgi:hypothetical protein
LIFRSLLFCDVSKVVLLHDSTFPLIWCFMIRTEHLDRLDNIIVVFTLFLDQIWVEKKTQPRSKGFFFFLLNDLVSPSTILILLMLPFYFMIVWCEPSFQAKQLSR